MGLIATVFIGLIIGLIARFLMPGRDPMGFILTAVLGIAGSWLGRWMGVQIGFYSEGEPAGFLMSVVGALVLLFLYRLLLGRKAS